VGAEFTIDHIVPQSLGGASTEDNLCLACWRCNLIKRDRIAAADSESGVIVRLFNPRQQPCGTVRPHPVAPGAELHRRMQWSPTAIVLRDEAHQTPNHCR
jgi:hypothetical protein